MSRTPHRHYNSSPLQTMMMTYQWMQLTNIKQNIKHRCRTNIHRPTAGQRHHLTLNDNCIVGCRRHHTTLGIKHADLRRGRRHRPLQPRHPLACVENPEVGRVPLNLRQSGQRRIGSRMRRWALETRIQVAPCPLEKKAD